MLYSGFTKPRFPLPMWLGVALLICGAAAALATMRTRTTANMVEQLLRTTMLEHSNELLSELASDVGQPGGLSVSESGATRIGHRSTWPADAVVVAVRTRGSEIFVQALRDPPAHRADVLHQAWNADDASGHEEQADDPQTIAWRTVRGGPLDGARLAVVYSTSRIDAAVRQAIFSTLRAQAIQVCAVLALVLAYLWIQAGALRKLAQHARSAFQSPNRITSPPRLRSRLVARELFELRDALHHAQAEAGAELSRNKELWQVFRSATSTGGEALVILDAQSNVLLCNERVETLLCRPLVDITGQPLGGVLAAESLALFDAEMQEFRRIGRHPLEGQAVERFALRSGGQSFPVQMMLRTVSFNGAPCVCVSMRELSDDKQRERLLGEALVQARQAHAAKARFLANMSHEIRTPLNGISGMAQLLGKTTLDPHQLELMRTLLSSTRRLRALLDDILDLSKIEAGQLRLEHRPFDVNLELRRAVESFKGAALTKALELDYEFSGELRVVIGDSYRLMQIVHNLLDNAIKFTDIGGVSVRVRTEPDPVEPDQCRIDVAVTDTGSGVPRELHSMLFAAFTQADETTTRRFGGTGLGLALSRELCQAMYGDITVQSEPGCGATFSFHVRAPLAPSSAAKPVAETVPEGAADVYLKGRRVLVADDSQVNRKVLEHLLKHAEMGIVIACDGEEALRLAESQDFDLVLMDVSMPRLNGYDATRAIRSLGSARARVPVIGVTALAMEGDRERCLASGMNAYVAKPIQCEELFRAMRHALRTSAAKEMVSAA